MPSFNELKPQLMTAVMINLPVTREKYPPVYLCAREKTIDCGHRVPNHDSKCRNLHGHTYRIELTAGAQSLKTSGSSEGMVVDFTELKQLLEYVEEIFDHKLILWKNDPLLSDWAEAIAEADKAGYQADRTHSCTIVEVPGLGIIIATHKVPTAENLAELWFQMCTAFSQKKGIAIWQIKVWETPSSFAVYPAR